MAVEEVPVLESRRGPKEADEEAEAEAEAEAGTIALVLITLMIQMKTKALLSIIKSFLYLLQSLLQ